MKANRPSAAFYIATSCLIVFLVATCVWAGNQAASQDGAKQIVSAADSGESVNTIRDKMISDQFIVLDPKTRGYQSDSAVLGVHVRTTDATLRQQLQLDHGVGLVIEHVTPESSADDAGLQRHDVLHKFDEQILVNPEQLHTLIQLHQPGDRVRLLVIRSGQQREISATLKPGTAGQSEVELFHDFHLHDASKANFAHFHDVHDPSIVNCSNCHMLNGRN